MSSRDEDLEWLYGRDKSPSAPEPTQVMPGFVPSGPGGSAGRTGAPPPPPRAPRTARPQEGGPERSAPFDSGRGAPFDTAQYPSAPANGQGASRPGPSQDWRPPGNAPTPPAPTLAPEKQRRRGPVRNVLIVLLLVVLAFVIWLVAVPLHAWSQVQRVDAAPSGQRPPAQPGTTFLLVGSDSRQGLSSSERNKLGTGNSVGQRTDTMMIMYVPPSGRPALISIPRDSYVSIPGKGKNKINAAYGLGGPKLLVKTVEQDTGLRVDGYMEIGFGGFVNIIDALGGIQMCIPKAIKDTDSHLDLSKGCQTLDGTNALGYVRMRKADPLGDLGRVQRQRQMLAAIAKKSATASTIVNPVRYWTLTHAVAGSITVGQDTSLWETVSMALAMRTVASGQGLTLTVPIGNANAYTPVGSSVLWDTAKAREMFADIARGDTSGLDKFAK